MSNDLKFWLARGSVFACIGINLVLLGKIMGSVMNPTHPHLKLFVTVFVVALAISIPVTMYYYFAKAHRWEGNQQSQDQIALETLSKLGEQRQQRIDRTQKDNS